MQDYWTRQNEDKPLYPNLIWSRPEQAAQSGKLLIIGGNAFGFSAPAEAFQAAIEAGIGSCRVILPDRLQKTVGRILEAGEYAPSTPSGSFAKNSLATLLEYSNWADATLLAGDFGRNSETAIALESFVTKNTSFITLTKDGIDYFIHAPLTLLHRKQTLLVMSFAQLQKYAVHSKFEHAFTFDMDFVRIIELLHIISSRCEAAIIVKHLDTIFVAYAGQISTTKLSDEVPIWRVKTAAHATVWVVQNPTKIFEALTTSII